MSGPEANDLSKQWVERAEEDFINARYILKLEEECPLGTVCFHSQQCVEKYLKAWLVQKRIAFAKTHDLIELTNLLPKEIRSSFSAEELAVLNRYAIESRYPGHWEPIFRPEAEEAFAIADKIRTLIRRLLSL
jgi:HEPN domain-containing protein